MESKPQVEEEKETVPTTFLDLKENTPSEEIVSMCMNCHKNGITRFLFTRVPFFKELIISSFRCEECSFNNTEVQFGGKIEDYGHEISLTVTDPVALNRNVVKSEYALIKIPELELEIPPIT